MPEVVAVKLRYNPKQLWFAPNGVDPKEGDHVIVETERGLEIGLCTKGPFEVAKDDIPAPLKSVARIATEADLETAEERIERANTMLSTFSELVGTYKLDMKPVRVEYLFDGDKAVFYFVSEERIDFRELVRDLAARFHVRIDMRQIGVRDEARMVGDLGHCGQQLCCVRLGGEFQPVSIRMAKEQDLPLNPAKISGVCGRLMCCLRHEFEAYKDFKGRAPKKGSIVDTPFGKAKVTSLDTPNEIISLRLEDGKGIDVPLGKMECDKKAGCCSVSREALEECENTTIDLMLSAFDRESEEFEVPFETPRNSGGSDGDRKPRKRGSSGGKGKKSGSGKSESSGSGEKPSGGQNRSRRRRGGRSGSDHPKSPDQKSNTSGDSKKKTTPRPKTSKPSAATGDSSQGGAPSGRRRRRRRTGDGDAS